MKLNKIFWFKTIAIVLPIVILCLAEVLLRLCGYGYNTDLFIQDPDDRSSTVMNRTASRKFFPDTANATKGNQDRFKTVKQPGTLRIFVLGESTTAGYPYMHNGSFPRWLQYRLLHTFPDRNFEIINLSLNAVNSYTVLDFGQQILPYHPDAVLIYTGHNEYYGALGVGSTSLISGSRWWIHTVLVLRKCRLVQLVESLWLNIGKLSGSKSVDTRDNLMKRMAANQQIAYGSDAYQRGIYQFQQNMGELCKLFSDAHIPVFLGTLVSNEKDLKPFVSQPGKYAANAVYDQARHALANGHVEEAKALYRKTREYDALRFRAPEAMNAAIRKLVKLYPGLYLADSQKFFEAHSANGIVGKETLLEHVHPNLFGYALMSEAFYSAMKQAHFLSPDAEKEISFPELWKQMPVTRVDSLFGAYQIMMLKTGWPFNIPIEKSFRRGDSMEEKIAGALAVERITWMNAMDELFKYSMKNGDKASALRATEAVLLEKPYNIPYYTYAGRLAFETGKGKNAAVYFNKAYQLSPTRENLENIYLLYLKQDLPELAMVQLNKLQEYSDQAPQLSRAKLKLEEIIKLKDSLKNGALNPVVQRQIAQDYAELNAAEAAKKYTITGK
ncbi:hypothetical protein ACSBL2_13330 [Pedobacter sp. AW31-3R]|uniref:hypothetical protein n=1 Tax=Pedobacter sp. AW31-3R TaxID=3445781 RepID=UPI003F9F2481